MKRQLTIFYGMANVGWTYPSYIHLCSELWIVTTLTNPAVFHIISSQNSHPPKKNDRLPNPNTKLHLKKFESVKTKEPPSHQKKHRIPSHHLSRWRDVFPAADSAGDLLLLLWGPPTPRRFFRVMEASPMRTHTNLRLEKSQHVLKAMSLYIHLTHRIHGIRTVYLSTLIPWKILWGWYIYRHWSNENQPFM